MEENHSQSSISSFLFAFETTEMFHAEEEYYCTPPTKNVRSRCSDFYQSSLFLLKIIGQQQNLLLWSFVRDILFPKRTLRCLWMESRLQTRLTYKTSLINGGKVILSACRIYHLLMRLTTILVSLNPLMENHWGR